MAKYVVPPMGNKPVIVKCRSCKTLYVPESCRASNNKYDVVFEPCPVCGENYNKRKSVIPLWKYNLIRWLRGEMTIEQADDSSTDD